MGSLLQPRYTLTIGSQQWTEQVLELRLSLGAAPLVDSLEVHFPSAAPLRASPEDPVDLTLDSGEKEEAVFRGTVASVGRDPRRIRLRALNASGRLARSRVSITYEQISAGNLIRGLCGEAGADAGQLDEGPMLAFYVADPMRTCWDHVGRLAAWGGAMARVDTDDRVETVVVNAVQAETALRWGREILDLDSHQRAAPWESFTVAGEGGAGDAAAPEVFRPSTDFFAGSRPDGPAPGHCWSSEPALRTVTVAATAAAARQRAYQASRSAGRFDAFLQPDLRPGTVLEIQDAPEGLVPVPIWLTWVQHRLGPAGASTRARFFEGGDAFDPMALLGSLMSLF